MKVLELIAFLEKFPDTATVHFEFPDQGVGGWNETELAALTFSEYGDGNEPVIVVNDI